MSSFIPNSYQTPNVYADQYMHLLTDSEWKVLSYAMRRIFGFNKRQDTISLSQFTDGTTDSEGNQLDYGTGLSHGTVAKCLKSLQDLRLIRLVAPNNPYLNQGACYELELDDRKINHDELARRQQEWSDKNSARMAKVRAGRMGQNDETTPSTTHDTPLYTIDTPPSIAYIPPPLLHSNTINSRNTEKNRSCVADFPQAPAQSILFETPAEPTVSTKAKPGPKPKAERTPEYEDYLARKKAIEQAYIELIGYTPTSFGEVARASKQLATAYYDASHLRGCWQHMMQNKFWSEKHASGEHIKLTSIANELPAWWSVEQARIAARKANEERMAQEQQQRRQVNEKILSPEERVAFVRKLRQEQRAFTQNATP